jgi:aldehyde dehydrogenase (NAD+)
MKGPSSPESIIEPSKFSFPPQTPSSPRDLPNIDLPYLPPREHCDYYIARYFEEVHCLYWLYPTEQFHARLEETYLNYHTISSRSWLCSLYSICALGAAGGDQVNDPVFAEMITGGARGSTGRLVHSTDPSPACLEQN